MVSITREFYFNLLGKAYTAKVTICRDEFNTLKGRVEEKEKIDEYIKVAIETEVEIDEFPTLESLVILIGELIDKEMNKHGLNLLYLKLWQLGRDSYVAEFENL